MTEATQFSDGISQLTFSPELMTTHVKDGNPTRSLLLLLEYGSPTVFPCPSKDIRLIGVAERDTAEILKLQTEVSAMHA